MQIRSAQPADADRIARIHVDSWNAAYAGLLPAAFLAGVDVRERSAMWRSCMREADRLYVAVDREAIVGFACIGTGRDPEMNGCTELQAIYLDPECYGSGVGTRLWKTIESTLPSGTVYLWVLANNALGKAFYAKNGFVPDGQTKRFTIGAESFEQLRYTKLLQACLRSDLPPP